MAAVSGFLAIILIVAIVCIKRKDRETHRYNVKTETQRIYEKRGSTGSDVDHKIVPPPIRKEVSFSMEADGAESPVHGYSTLKSQQTWNHVNGPGRVSEVS